MKILVFTDEASGLLCPKCGERIKLNPEIIDIVNYIFKFFLKLY